MKFDRLCYIAGVHKKTKEVIYLRRDTFIKKVIGVTNFADATYVTMSDIKNFKGADDYDFSVVPEVPWNEEEEN